MILFLLVACSTPRLPPTIAYDGATVSVDDRPIGPWATACPASTSTCGPVEQALRRSARLHPDVVATIDVGPTRTWDETSRLLLTAAEAGHATPDLIVTGRPAVRFSVVDPSRLAQAPLATLAVGGHGAHHWLTAVVNAVVAEGATCASVYAQDKDLRAVCDAATGTDAPAEVRLGSAHGCLVPMLVGTDPADWRLGLAAALGGYAGEHQLVWVLAGRDSEAVSILQAVAEGATNAGLPPLSPAEYVDAAVPDPGTCEGAVTTAKELDEAIARSIGAGTAAERGKDGQLHARAPSSVGFCEGAACGEDLVVNGRFAGLVTDADGRRWAVLDGKDGVRRGVLCDGSLCDAVSGPAEAAALGRTLSVRAHKADLKGKDANIAVVSGTLAVDPAGDVAAVDAIGELNLDDPHPIVLVDATTAAANVSPASLDGHPAITVDGTALPCVAHVCDGASAGHVDVNLEVRLVRRSPTELRQERVVVGVGKH